jgi:putative aminopeptidase FrvX
MFELIKTLTEMSGPIGQEHAVVDYVETLWQQGGAQTERTKLNNLLAHVGGQGPKHPLVAHAAEPFLATFTPILAHKAAPTPRT